jgi:AcrR family transcriptional regulator
MTEAPTTRRRERTRDRLLDAAFEVFAENGVHATSVEEICERAGFTRGAFYSNFRAKEELFVALMQQKSTHFLDVLAGRIDELRPLVARAADLDEDSLIDLVLRLSASPFDDRTWALISAEFRLLALRDPAFAAAYLAQQAEFEASIVDVVEHALALAHRRFRAEPAAAVHLLAGAYGDAVCTAILAGGDAVNAEHARPTLARLVLLLTEPTD